MKKEYLAYFNIVILCTNHSLNLAEFILLKASFMYFFPIFQKNTLRSNNPLLLCFLIFLLA